MLSKASCFTFRKLVHSNIIVTLHLTCVNNILFVVQGLYRPRFHLKYVEVRFVKQEYKKYYEQFGLNVVYYRKKKRLTQMKLAELVDIDRSHISAIELGNVDVSFDVIFKLCEVLDVTPKQLFDFRE